MQFSGAISSVETVRDDDSGATPMFLYNEPAAEKLLYTRAALGLETKLEVPAVSVEIPPPSKPLLGAEFQQLRDQWGQAWDGIWAMYCESYEPEEMVSDHRSQSALSIDTWLALVARLNSSVDCFDEWSAGIDRRPGLSPDHQQFVSAAQRAYRRGLRCVFVLPVHGKWSKAIQRRILLISTSLHDSTEDLSKELDRF